MRRRTFITKAVTTAGLFSVAPRGLVALAQDRVYLTEQRALKLVFSKSQDIVKDTRELSDAQLSAVERRLGVRLRSRVQTVYRGVTSGSTDEYAMIINEIGKDQYITFIVGITKDFRIDKVALMVFRESRGWEIEDARFTNQFKGKTSRDRLLIGSDIIGITGATLSSRALCRGARKALIICEALYKS